MPKGIYPHRTGFKLSKKTREKISKVKFGYKHTPETRKKMRLAKLGKPSPCIGQKRPCIQGKNHPMFGKHHTKEACKKMSESRKGRIGPLSHSWKGGRLIKSQLYILIHAPNHPHKTKGNYVYEHRLVMEKHLGRYLRHEEVVHHINGNKHDNRIENLRLYANDSNHRQSHPLVHNGNPKQLKTLTI